jgi:hypothetical protein
VRLPAVIEPPAQVVVCECCWRAGCWYRLADSCVGVSGGRPRTSITMTAEEVQDLAYESPSFWHGPRSADQPPRDVAELLDAVQYASTRPNASREQTRLRLVAQLGIDADQVDEALAQAWPLRRAS